MEISVRKERDGDILSIRRVTEFAFKDAEYSSQTEQWIVEALREDHVLTVSLVAELDGSVVGHVAISPVTISDGARNWYGLGPISVLPAHQNRGIGSLLIQKALLELEVIHADGCVVLGEPGYYGRFGFKVHEGLVYPNVPPEYFQALSFSHRIPLGEVSYHESFNARE